MSVKVTGMVFERYSVGGGEMLLALALADHAHDDGTHIFPSIARLAAKTRQSERSVQYQLRRMEASGWLILVNSGTGGRKGGYVDAGRTREYRINPEWMKGAEIAPIEPIAKGAEIAPLERPSKGAIGDAQGCKLARPRVQKEPSKGAKLLHPNQKQPKATVIEPHSTGADAPSGGVCGTSAGRLAAALNRAALATGRTNHRIASQNPELIAAAAEGVNAEHLLELADMYPDKPAGYLIAAARRQHSAIAPATTTASAHATTLRAGPQSLADRSANDVAAYQFRRRTEGDAEAAGSNRGDGGDDDAIDAEWEAV
ncbi:helix-turn-helix domain-containing protein [Xanthomonas theicola]|uniref:helix-turn-helix domain-containing protein n=1 Tax=Xanthomonas theicola TaxID=56464 RepID=UPI000FF89547|nr:helix-turn-helix domain-containing protein [Xanthomonas theicola]QNH24815.1 hypothetical protein G4Q83_08740 [Xanthomonas theicola]